MGRKKINPIKETLSSKVYLAAYPKYKTGYEIGGELKVPINKVYEIIKKYPKLFDRKQGEGRSPIRSKAEPLIEEIENILEFNKVEKLTYSERSNMLKILDSEEFRSYIDLVTKDSYFALKGFDATYLILFCLNLLSACGLNVKKYDLLKSYSEVAKKEGLSELDAPVDLMYLICNTAPESLMLKLLTIKGLGLSQYNVGRYLMEKIAQTKKEREKK